MNRANAVAVQWTGNNADELIALCSDKIAFDFFGDDAQVETPDGPVNITVGDWVIWNKGSKGFTTMPDELFKEQYVFEE